MAGTISQPASVAVTIDGTVYQQNVVNTVTAEYSAEPSVPAAKVGALTTRTDSDTGTFTMNSGHGFATSDKVAVFWDGGSRWNMTATVTGDSVVLDGGLGDNLPAAATAITAMKPTQVEFLVTGDNVLSVGAYCPVSGRIVFCTGTTVVASYQILPNLGNGKAWFSGQTDGGTNPLAGADVDNVKFMHGDSTQAQTLKAAVGY